MNTFHHPAQKQHRSFTCNDADGAHTSKDIGKRSACRSSFALIALSVLSVLYGIATMVPLYAQYQLTFPLWVLSFVGVAGVAFIGFFVAYNVIARLHASSGAAAASQSGSGLWAPRKAFIVCFALIELAFLFALASNYPGLCSPDSNAILSQVNGQSYYDDSNRYEGLTNAHPIFYTFLIWLVFKVTSFLESQSISLFVFMFLQVTYVAAALACALAWLSKTGAHRTYLACACAFVVLSPVIASHVIILWKDIPFAATLLLLVIHLSGYVHDKRPARKQIFTLAILLLLASLFRNNGYYVALFTLAYLLVFRPFLRKQAAALALALVVFMGVLQGPVFGALSISKGHFAESVGIPLQQLAATVVAGGTISQSDREIMENILPLEQWEESYDPSTSNPIKQNELFNDEYLDTHKVEFLAVWLRTLPGNISTYVRAWVLETYGYWQPGYNTYIGKLTATANDQPASDLVGIGYKPQLIANALRELFPALFGMGSLIWFSLGAMTLSIIFAHRKRCISAAITPYVPLLGLFVTMLIAAPIVSDYRYIFALYLVIPFLPQLFLLSARDEASKVESSKRRCGLAWDKTK